MAEPTITTGAAWAVAAGLTSAFMAALGVTWPLVFFAACGSYFGAGWAPPVGRVRIVIGFVFSSILAAKGGLVGAAWCGPIGKLSDADLAQGIAALLGILFYPLIAAAVQMVPAIARLKPGASQEPKQ